jgi:hypothetical protein
MNDSERLDLERTMKEAQQTGMEVLLADAESAHAFLDVAASSTQPEAIERNIAQARKALATISHFLGCARGDEPMIDQARTARDRLQDRLAALSR